VKEPEEGAPQVISVGDANAVHFLLALTSGGNQQLAASEQESGDRVRVEGSYRRRHSKGWHMEEPGDVLILSAPCIVKPPPSPGAKFSQGRSGSPAIGTPSIFSSSTAQPLASTSARIDLLTVDGSRLPRPGALRIIIQSTSPWCRTSQEGLRGSIGSSQAKEPGARRAPQAIAV